MDDIIIKNRYVKPPQYAEMFGIPVQRVRRMCEAGELEAFRDVEGGHWFIKVDSDGESGVSKKYEELVRENERLKLKLAAIADLLGSAG